MIEKTVTNWIEINLSSLSENLKAIREKTGKKTKIIGIIKQQAYGHGIVPVAKRLESEKIEFLGVNNINEAKVLLKNKIKTPILILSNTISEQSTELLINNQIRFTVMDEELLEELNEKAKQNNTQALIHIKVDTGMNRLGVRTEKAFSFITHASKLNNVVLEGVYSHLSVAESNVSYSQEQIEKLKRIQQELKKKNIEVPYYHIYNSAGLTQYSDKDFNMARTGLMLYGIKPEPSLDIGLSPVLSLKSRIIHLKEIPKGQYVSYGNTFKTDSDILAGVIRFGYAYGYPWNLSNNTEVLIRGKRCNVLGRICMDHMIVDLNAVRNQNIKTGEPVTLIGKEDNEHISAEELAEKAQTIPYEIITRLPISIPRIYC